jgi:autotransporter family porin
MKRPITMAVLTALLVSSAVAVQVGAASSESKDTKCWDLYNLRGTRKSSTVAPTGLSTGDCTPAVGCYYTYRASDGQRTKWAVPYGMKPKDACGPDGSAPTTAATTTTVSGTLLTSAAANPSQVAIGASVTLSAMMRSDIERNVLVDIEVYNPAGQQVFQFWWDDQSFAAGDSKTLSTNWTLPSSLAAGTYTLKIGVFGAGWSGLVAWNDAAGTIAVGSATTTSSSIPSIPSVPPGGSGGFATLPVGAALPSGAECASRVKAAVEIRPENAAANGNEGSRANANTRPDWSGFSRVDGDFSGTTDEIIQWAACKWGIDENIARAQVIKESYWYQSANGDNGESWGLGQVRDGYGHEPAFQYSVNARTSSAYNLDYTYASWRACYEGVYTWLNDVERVGTYAAGDVWGCLGVWFSGRWYVNNDAYLNEPGDSVRWHYDNKTWLTPTFING